MQANLREADLESHSRMPAGVPNGPQIEYPLDSFQRLPWMNDTCIGSGTDDGSLSPRARETHANHPSV